MFQVNFTKEDKSWSKGSFRGGFETYLDAFNWAIANIVDGYVWKVQIYKPPLEKPKVEPKRIRLSLHTNTFFTIKE